MTSLDFALVIYQLSWPKGGNSAWNVVCPAGGRWRRFSQDNTSVVFSNFGEIYRESSVVLIQDELHFIGSRLWENPRM